MANPRKSLLPPPWNLARDQQGRPIVPAQWLGPAEGPDLAVCALYRCPWCGAESITRPDVWAYRTDRETRASRDEHGIPFVRTEERRVEWAATAPCQGCGIEFALRIRGRLFEPWRLGEPGGVVKPLPPGSYVVEDEPEGGER